MRKKLIDYVGYGKHNIYVGKYTISKYGHIQLPDADIFAVQALETTEGLVYGDEAGSEVALIIRDGNFFPVISLLSPDEADALALELRQAAEYLRAWNKENSNV